MNTGKPFPVWIIIALVLVSVIAIIAVFILNSNSDGGTTTCQKVGDECDDTNTCCDTGVCTKNVCVATDNCVKINGDCTADSDCCTGSVCSTNKTCQISGTPSSTTTWMTVTGYSMDGSTEIIDGIDGGTETQCKAKCDSDPSCLGVVMIADGSGCNMARTFSPRTQDSSATSYIKTPTAPYTLLSTFNANPGTPDEQNHDENSCKVKCQNYDKTPCSIYSYDLSKKYCYLNTDITNLVGNPDIDTHVLS